MFWTVFSAFLAANLLTVVFVWGMYTYSRHEREGTAGNRASNLPWLACGIPLLFLIAGLYTAL
jgi:hypothetical protein